MLIFSPVVLLDDGIYIRGSFGLVVAARLWLESTSSSLCNSTRSEIMIRMLNWPIQRCSDLFFKITTVLNLYRFPTALLLLLFPLLPESPRYLVAKGQTEAAEKVSMNLFRKCFHELIVMEFMQFSRR